MSEHSSVETPRTEAPRLRAIPGGRDERPRRTDSEIRPMAPVQTRPRTELLWREALGRRLRILRREQGETLAETAERAGVSPQYLSEVERGLKEPSSEMVAAMAGALGTPLGGLVHQVADDLVRHSRIAAPRAIGPRTHAPYNGLLLAA
ncbi:helix-turn-helix domain-containing protein [Nocardia sp. NPDC127579]|uniref:helix-turn-helix domain-containing protein n=1 Tax=Nocardia sp. NPDC127579 TaxID=3345402 RepID=UPI003643C825